MLNARTSTDIREIVTDKPIPRLVSPRYEALKRTPIYDAPTKTWRDVDDEKGPSPEVRTDPQLWAALVEAEINSQDADPLRRRILAYYSEEDRYWQRDDIAPVILNIETTPQLLGALALQRVAPEEAAEHLTWLKVTHLYDNTGLWRAWSRSGPRGIDAHDQLLAVIIEWETDPAAAKKLLEKLKSGPLYDRKRMRWGGSMNGSVISLEEPTYTQLVGVLVEFLVDEELARRLYESLRNERFAAERGRWIEPFAQGGVTLASLELLDTLVRLRLGIEQPRPEDEAAHAIPHILDIN